MDISRAPPALQQDIFNNQENRKQEKKGVDTLLQSADGRNAARGLFKRKDQILSHDGRRFTFQMGC